MTTDFIWAAVAVLLVASAVLAARRYRVRCETRQITGGDFVAARAIRARQGKPFALAQRPRLRPATPTPVVPQPMNVRPLKEVSRVGL